MHAYTDEVQKQVWEGVQITFRSEVTSEERELSKGEGGHCLIYDV